MEHPFNDDLMHYDYKAHRYVLKPEAVRNDLGINLSEVLNNLGDTNPSTLPERFLNDVSQKLYSYIYKFSPQKYLIEYRLAKDPYCRDLIYECLCNEVKYTLKNGDFWNYAGVNLSKAQAMPLDALRNEGMVSALTEQQLSQPLPDGFKLLYRGMYILPVGYKKWREDY